jgi:hypothetical protein
MGTYSSATRQGAYEPFELQVARGQVDGHKPLFKFGINGDVGTSPETVWAQGGTYSYLSAAAVMKISSSSTDDAAAGTGARTIKRKWHFGLFRQGIPCISQVFSLHLQTQTQMLGQTSS